MNITKETVRLYWQHAWRYPHLVIGLLVSVPLTVLIGQYLPPLILASVLNRLSHHNYQPHQVWNSFGPELVVYAILVMFGGAIMWRIVDRFGWKLEAHVQQDLARRIFSHLLSQSASFHANHFGGSMVSQTNKVLGSYIRIADTTVYQVIPLLMSLVFASIILAHRAPLFVIVLVAFALAYMVSAIFVTKNVRTLTAKNAAQESKQTGYLADNVTNVMAIKSFSGSKFENKAFGRITNATYASTLAVMRGHARQQIYFSSMTGAISAMSLTVAVISVLVFNADLATVFLILTYTSSIVNQLFSFSNSALRNYNRALGDARDMVEVLHIIPEVLDPEKPEEVAITKGGIDFKNVVFSHDGSDGALFDGLSVAIKPGEKIGLVGHSGSGKTTLTRLLLRFSDIDGGAITIDGQNIAHITQDDLRSKIAYVPQEPLLFHRTLRENIAYGAPDATEEQIHEAARKAHASDFIEQLQDGYETLVGERGVKLSGGQRQRIVIARAILKDAPILVLDEATSALDSESEILIQKALQELMKKRTAIVIAHRLSTIQKMDRILVLEQGHVVEQGSHTDLVNKKGVYAQLWAHQSGGFIEE